MEPRARVRFWGVVCAAVVPIGLLACGSDHGKPSLSGANNAVGGAGGDGVRGGAGGQGGSGTGAGGGQDMSSAWKSGARLRAQVLDGGDGAVSFLGWYDSAKDVPCAFLTAEDGAIRCLPDEDQPAVLRYLDAACTQPIALRSCGSQAKYLVTAAQPNACDAAAAPRAVHEVGPALPSATTYMLGGSVCVPAGPAAQDAELHSITPAPAASFAAATLAEEPRGHRLAVKILRGEDGSSETVAIRDTLLDMPCSAQVTGPDELRCAPALGSLASGSYYGDDTCGAPLLTDLSTPANCPVPELAPDDSEPSGCSPVWKAIHVGEEVGADSVYQGSPAMCTAVSIVPQGWAFYERGDAFDVSTLAPVTEMETGTGRLLTAHYMADAHQSLLPAGGFYDTERAQPCGIHAFSDGKLRCVPADVDVADFYSDNTCTTPVASVPFNPMCLKAPPKEAVTTTASQDPMCLGSQVVEHVYSLGAKFAGPKVWLGNAAGGCTELDPTALTMDFYALDGELDANVFAEVIAKRE